MIEKKDLINRTYYLGTCRNTKIAMWLNDDFIFINFNFHIPYIEHVKHYSDVKDINRDGFIPIKIVDIEYDEIRMAKDEQDYKNYYRKIYLNINPESINGEIWKNVVNYEGLYEVSNYGRIKKISNNTICKQNFCREYLVLGLTKNKVRKTFRVHRLVAFAFKPETYKKTHEVNHKNGIKTDNRNSNIEWSTHSSNSSRTFSSGNNIKKLTNDMVNEIREMLIKKEVKQKEIAKLFNVSTSTISEIKTGKKWKNL